MPSAISASPTQKLCEAGQSPWLDYLSRDMIVSGKLKALIEKSGVLGVTSNPSIFQSAISQSKGAYDSEIASLIRKGASTLEIYDALTIADIQKACDLFKKVHNSTQGEHGYVSLEVLPNIAYDTESTVCEGLRLFKAVNRVNVMIKVPATQEGIFAIRQLIAAGVNINVTLIFTLKQYQDVAEAYLLGLKDRLAKGEAIRSIRSVASVFVSRFDTWIDKKLEVVTGSDKRTAQELFGKAGVANSKLIYHDFQKIISSERFMKLRKQGANIQKVLWGSTSCKNPNYPDLLYVEPLVGKETVNTMPQVTLDAVLDHAEIQPDTIESRFPEALRTAEKLDRLGLSLGSVGDLLQKQGVILFCQAFDDLMRTLEIKRLAGLKTKKVPGRSEYRFYFSGDLGRKVEAATAQFKSDSVLKRFLAEDPTIWKSDEVSVKSIKNRLGWLKAHEWVIGKLYELEQLKSDCAREKYQDIVLLGMGGSSLAPEVMSLICHRATRLPRFSILDSTDPVSIGAVLNRISIRKTLFILASKSGSTIETLSQYQFFYEQCAKAYGARANLNQLGSHWIAITDPGSALEKLAREKKFRKCFLNPANIGGRFSALSLFGLVPAVLMGINIRDLIQSAASRYQVLLADATCPESSDLVKAGIALGVLSKSGKEKMTLVTTKSLESFGAWMEQLVAESTGKEKLGVLPVDTETLGEVPEYAEDRVFVSVRLKGDVDYAGVETRLRKFSQAGFPWIDIILPSPEALGGEFFAWEVITGIIGVVLQVNPFDEPNVTESKEITARLLEALKKGKVPENPTRYYSVNRVVELGLILKQIKRGSYLSLLAYVDRNPSIEAAFQKIRLKLRKRFKIPVLLGFGPRYLHSIGQFYKGGTPSGLFIEFVTEATKDYKVPNTHYTFGQLFKSQALGDFEAIQNKGLPIIMVNLGSDAKTGLARFEQKLVHYLASSK